MEGAVASLKAAQMDRGFLRLRIGRVRRGPC